MHTNSISMKRIRFFFILLVVEMVFIGIIGFMTLDNNQCDAGTSWHWSYVMEPKALTYTQCPMLTVSVQSTAPRFYVLLASLAILPMTALIGLFMILGIQEAPAANKQAFKKSNARKINTSH